VALVAAGLAAFPHQAEAGCPSSHSSYSCNSICVTTSGDISCDLALYGGTSAAVLTSYRETDGVIYAWGNDANGDRYCCDLGSYNRTCSNSYDIVGGDGDDTVTLSYVPFMSTLKGVGTISTDVSGGDGNDTLHGHGGDDTMYGGEGNDTMYGGSGDDSMLGGNGNDNMYGDNGEDIMCEEAGYALMDGGTGDDVMVFAAGGFSPASTGDAGNDTCDVSPVTSCTLDITLVCPL
jgi:Ca2+-binding RTX toxin-like protein